MSLNEITVLIVWLVWSTLIVFSVAMVVSGKTLPYKVESPGPFFIWSIATVLVVIYFAFS